MGKTNCSACGPLKVKKKHVEECKDVASPKAPNIAKDSFSFIIPKLLSEPKTNG